MLPFLVRWRLRLIRNTTASYEQIGIDPWGFAALGGIVSLALVQDFGGWDLVKAFVAGFLVVFVVILLLNYAVGPSK